MRDEHAPFFTENRSARIIRKRPSCHPPQTKVRIKTVKVGHTRQEPERVLSHVELQRTMPKLDHCGTERGTRDRTHSEPVNLAERAIDDGGGMR